MPRLLNSAVGLKGTTGTNTYFITLSEAQPNLGVTPTTSTGYTLVTQGPLKQLAWTNTLGDIAFQDGLAYRNTPNGDLTLTSTGSGKLNLVGNVFINGQELAANTGSFNFLYSNTASIQTLTSTNFISVSAAVNSGTINKLYATTATFEYLYADTATIFDSFSAFGSVSLSPISYNVNIAPGGGGTVYIDPSAMGLIDNMTIGLNIPRNGYFTNLTADTLTLNQPININTGSFNLVKTIDLVASGISTLTNVDAGTINVDLLTATNIISNSATILGSLYAGSLYDSGNRVITQVTVSAGLGLSGGGTVNGTSGTVALTNTGVLSIIAGTDTVVTTSTGNVVVWNTSTLQSVTERGSVTNQSISITNTTSSTSSTTGALTVAGGVGVGNDLSVAGFIKVGTGAGTATGDDNLIRPLSDSAFLNLKGGGGYAKVSIGNTNLWLSAGTNAPIIFSTNATSRTGAGVEVMRITGDYKVGIGTATPTAKLSVSGTVSITGVTTITNTTSATSTVTGALQVAGGVGIGDDLQVGKNVYSAGGSPYYNRLLYTPQVTVDVNPPANPRIGDFWIDPTAGVEYQLVPNGTSTVWVQFIGF